MELELGLALPNHNPEMIKELDLNSSNDGFEMEIPNQKRRFLLDQQHGIEVESKLSLLLWNVGGEPDEEDNDGRRQKSRKALYKNDDRDEENQERDGWPPINSSRKELPHRHDGGLMTAEEMRNSTYVKVKMEGVAIGRKIDLRHYDSYQNLTNTLLNMFAKYSEIDKNKEYTLLYQDKEGDWMLVGDVQWEKFVESVQRLEILKNDSKMGFRLLSRKSYCKI